MVRFSRVFIIGAFFLASGGCTPVKQTPVTSTSTHNETKSAADDAPKAATTTAKDQPDPTLYPDEYEARGMPPIQDPWTADAHKKAAGVLVALFNENPALLPRLESKHSNSVFRRMVSRENLDMYANRDMEPGLRMSSLVVLGKTTPVYLAVYGNALLQGHLVDREMLEVSLYMAYAIAVTWEGMDDQAAKIYQPDAQLSQRLAGVEESQKGLTKFLSGTTKVLTDREFIRLENHIWFASEFASILPRLSNRLDPQAHAELEQRLRQLATTEPERELAKQFKRLHASLKDAKPPLVPRPPNMSVGTP